MLLGIVGKGDPVKSIFSYHVKSIRFMEKPLVHTLEPIMAIYAVSKVLPTTKFEKAFVLLLNFVREQWKHGNIEL